MNTIETERLLLRPWKVDDAAEAASLFRYASDPEIGLRCGWPPHTSVEGSMHDIRNILAVENNWAITIKGGAPNSNAPVGSIALMPVSHYTADAVASDPELTKRYGKYLGDNALEVGYWIGRPFWGKGYMPEALTAVLGYAFDTLRKDAVWGGHFAENTQSGRVQAKCGLHVVAESKQDYYPLIDRHYDRVYRIITAGEWRDAEHRQMARDRLIHERASLRQRHIMQDMTTRIVPIEPQWFMQKAEVQSRTWRELNQGHIPQDIVDAITPAFALKLTRGHAADPNQVVLIALADDRVVGFIELLRTPRPPINRPEAAELASLYVLESEHRHGVGRALVEAGRQAVGNDRLVLWVVGFNTNAQGFYRHIGFHETGLTQTEDMGPELEMINY